RFDAGESIMIAAWPSAAEAPRDAEAEEQFAFLQEVVTEIRRLQTGAPAALGKSVELDRSWAERLGPQLEDVAAVTRAEIAFAELDGAKARLRVAEGVDAGPLIEVKRKKLKEAREKLSRKRGKLRNEGFVSKAPPAVVEGERADVLRLQEEERRLLAELAQLGASGD